MINIENINKCLSKKYRMDYNYKWDTLTIKEKILVKDFLIIRSIIKRLNIKLGNLIVEI